MMHKIEIVTLTTFFLLLLYYLYKIFGSSGQHTGVIGKND